MKKSLIALLLVFVFVLGVGCSAVPKEESGENPTEQIEPTENVEKELRAVSLRLNWTAQGSHAPIWYGIKEGIFEKHGIDLTAGEGKGSGTTVNVIASKGDTFGWADCGTIFNLISQDAPVKMIAPVYTKSSFAVISIEENNITKVEDLVGKKIGTTEGDGPHKLLPALLKGAGIDISEVELVPMDSSAKVPALLNKQVDAILGGFDDQPYAIEAKGYKPTVISYCDNGVNLLGMSLVANEETLENDPEMVKDFLVAYAESWVAAYNDPEGALDALLEVFPDLDRDTAKNQMNAGFELITSDSAKGLLDVPEDIYMQTIDLCKSYLGLDSGVEAENLYTVKFIPEEPILLK